MAKAKMGMFNLDINKKFSSGEEAYLYAKRLKDFLENYAKNNKRFIQAMIVTSNLNGKAVSSIRYEKNGNVGKPKVIKNFCDPNSIVICNGIKRRYISYIGGLNTDWHIHVLLLSYPGVSCKNELLKYINKNWKEVKRKYNVNYKKIIEDKEKGIAYLKRGNIGVAEYIINQSDKILFVNKNYTGKEMIPKEYSLKRYYNEYLKVNTERYYNDDYYNREGYYRLTKVYRELREFYFSLTKEYDYKDNNGIDRDKYKRYVNKVQKIKEYNSKLNAEVAEFNKRILI